MQVGEYKNLFYDFLVEPKFRIGRHVLFIIIFSVIAIGQSLFILGDLLTVLGNYTYIYTTDNLVIITTLAYINLYILAPRLLLKSSYVKYFTILGLSIAIYLIFKWLFESHILSEIGIQRHFNFVTLLDFFSNLTTYTIFIISSALTILFRQWTSDSERISTLKNKQLKGGVDELKNRINPKSISNVLDYVSEKVQTNSKEASEILFKLSDVLRYELYDCKREKVLLESDIGFIDKYLALEQLSRHGFTYKIVNNSTANLFISPFSFLPSILKIIEKQPARIVITFEADEKSVYFSCDVSEAVASKENELQQDIC